jgi:hypothetical protein
MRNTGRTSQSMFGTVTGMVILRPLPTKSHHSQIGGLTNTERIPHIQESSPVRCTSRKKRVSVSSQYEKFSHYISPAGQSHGSHLWVERNTQKLFFSPPKIKGGLRVSLLAFYYNAHRRHLHTMKLQKMMKSSL